MTRRLLFKRGGILAGASLLAPTAQIWIPRSAAMNGPASDVERAAAEMLARYRSQGGYFTAQAIGFFAGFAMLLGAIAAIVQILEYLNIRPHFNPDVRYDAESGCAQRFQQAEYFARQNNLRNFNGVSQTSFDTNHLVLAATSQSAENLGIFATQYQQTPTVTLTGSEADVIQAAMTFARKQYNVQGGQLGGTSAVVRKFDQHIGGNPIRTFSTACGGFVLHDCTPSNGQPHGQICLHIPGVTDTRNLPAITLTA